MAATMLEFACDAIKDRVMAREGTTLRERIDLLNKSEITGEPSHDVSIEMYRADNVMIGRPMEGEIYEFPVLLIWPENFPMTEVSWDSVDGPFAITLWIGETGDTQERLMRKLARQLEALVLHLGSDWTLGDAVDKFDFVEGRFDHPFVFAGAEGYVDFCGLRIQVHKETAVQ